MKISTKYMVLLSAITFLVFSNGLGGDFVYDDVNLVKNNPSLRHLSSIPRAFGELFSKKDLSHFEKKIDWGYRPLRNSSYCVDYFFTRIFFPSSISGHLSPVIFHLTNIIIHIFNTLILFLILSKIFSSPKIAFWATLFFALHPLQTESVTYISGRRDVLAGFFSLCVWWLYLRGNKGRWTYGAIIFLFVGGLLSKEVVLALPLALFWFGWTQKKNIKKEKVFWIAMAFLSCAFGYFKIFYKNPTALGLAKTGYWGGCPLLTLYTMGRVLWKYFQLILFPIHLTPDYSYRAFEHSTSIISPWTTLPALVGVLVLLVILWKYRKSLGAFGGWWFLIFLLPASQIIPHPERMAERFLYLPLAGIAMILCWFLQKKQDSKWTFVVCFLALALLGGRTFYRNQDWQNSESLWGSAVSAYPQCARAQMAYGKALLDRGDQWIKKGKVKKAKQDWQRALDHLQKGRALSEGGKGRRRAIFLNSLFLEGLACLKLERYGEAKSHLQRLIEEKTALGSSVFQSSYHIHVHLNLAAAYQGLKQDEKAKKLYQQVLFLSPGEPRALVDLANLYQKEGEIEKAEKLLRQALKNPDLQGELAVKARLALAVLLFNQRRYREILAELHPLINNENSGENPLVFYLLAKSYRFLSNASQAVFFLQKADQCKNLPASLIVSLAQEWLALGKIDRAHRFLERTFEPTNFDLLALLINIKIRLKRPQEALDLLEHSVILTPRLLVLKGKLLEDQGKKESALLAYQQSYKKKFYFSGIYRALLLAFQRGEEKRMARALTKKYPRQKKLFLALSKAYQEQNRFLEGLKICQKGLKIFPKDPKLQQKMAQLKNLQEKKYDQLITLSQRFYYKKKYSKALKLAREAFSVNPKRAPAFEWQARCFYKQKKFSPAGPLFEKALSLKSYGSLKAEIQTKIGWCFFEQNRWMKALSKAKIALSLFPDYRPAWKLAGMALWRLGQKKRGRMFLQKYIQTLGPGEEMEGIERMIR